MIEEIQKPKTNNQATVDTERVRQYGFTNTNELINYIENQYWSHGVNNTRKQNAFSVEDAPWGGKNTAILRQGNRSDTQAFVNWLKTRLNIYVESYGNDSWFVHMSKDSDGFRKPRKPKNIK